MIYITGDTHGRLDYRLDFLYESGTEDDVLIICGDFGIIWNTEGESYHERLYLKWLEDSPFTTVFVDGNHENFDRLYDYPVKEWCGGKVHEIRPNVLHLMRGEVFNIQGKKFFAFGGASSHDVQDGIIDPNDFKSDKELTDYCNKKYMSGEPYFRIKNRSWWERELPTEEEMKNGLDNLEKHNFKVDYVISHCMPQNIAAIIVSSFYGDYKSDVLTYYFDYINDRLEFNHWYSGHYHVNKTLYNKYSVLYREVNNIE